MDRNIPQWLINTTDKDILQTNLSFISLFIAVYENMVDYVETNLESFLCEEYIENGKLKYKKTPEYKKEILNRIVDDKGNKNVTKSCFLWLVDNNAITQGDYEDFLVIKEVRNRYAHNLTDVIYQSVSEHEIKSFAKMRDLYRKISKWYFLNIDATIMGYELPDESDWNDVLSGVDIMFSMIIDILFDEKEEQYKSMLGIETAPSDRKN